MGVQSLFPVQEQLGCERPCAAVDTSPTSQWNHIVEPPPTLSPTEEAQPSSTQIIQYPNIPLGICCDRRNTIAFILCLCPEPTGQIVADHRLPCDSEVKLIMRDFLTRPNQKSTLARGPAVDEPAFQASTPLSSSDFQLTSLVLEALLFTWIASKLDATLYTSLN